MHVEISVLFSSYTDAAMMHLHQLDHPCLFLGSLEHSLSLRSTMVVMRRAHLQGGTKDQRREQYVLHDRMMKCGKR